MGFHDVALQSSQASFPPHVTKIVVEVKALGLSHVLKLWLWVRKGMLPVEYFCSNKAPFLCQLNFMEIIRLSQSRDQSGHPQFGGTTGFKIVVTVLIIVFIHKIILIFNKKFKHQNIYMLKYYNYLHTTVVITNTMLKSVCLHMMTITQITILPFLSIMKKGKCPK